MNTSLIFIIYFGQKQCLNYPYSTLNGTNMPNHRATDINYLIKIDVPTPGVEPGPAG